MIFYTLLISRVNNAFNEIFIDKCFNYYFLGINNIYIFMQLINEIREYY